MEIQTTKEPIQEIMENALSPGKMRVIKRNGKVVGFENEKIKVAIMKAFLAVEGGAAAGSSRIHENVEELTSHVIEVFERRMPSGGTIHIEEIQDQVELQLMRSEHHKVARSYVLYREERKKERSQPEAKKEQKNKDENDVSAIVKRACEGLDDVDAEQLTKEINAASYEGMTVKDLADCMVITSRTMVEKDPNYSFVTARILLNNIEDEVLSFLGLDHNLKSDRQAMYEKALKATVKKGNELGFVDEKLNTFDLEKLGEAIIPQRDQNFTYLGLQTLYDRYFITSEETRYELPQVFLMRVSMGLAINEEQKNERAIEFYSLLSSFDYMRSYTTLLNSGTNRPNISSCYLTTLPVDL